MRGNGGEASERQRVKTERLYERIFPRWIPEARFRPVRSSVAERAVALRWLGTASFVIETASTTVLVDPYLTRKPLLSLPFAHEPDERAIFQAIPRRVDAILCGHSHYDHIADAPRIARRTGALLVGSESTCAWGAAEGLPEAQLVRVGPRGRAVTIGDIEVRFIPSQHGKALFHRVPLPGFVHQPPRLPSPIWAYKMGGAFGVHLRVGELSLYHNGSADLIDAELRGVQADVLLACLAGRRGTEGYLRRLVDHLRPGLVVPTHHDAFFAPLARGVHLLPRIDLGGFLAEAQVFAPKATRVTLDYGETLSIPVADARASALIPRA